MYAVLFDCSSYLSHKRIVFVLQYMLCSRQSFVSDLRSPWIIVASHMERQRLLFYLLGWKKRWAWMKGGLLGVIQCSCALMACELDFFENKQQNVSTC